MFTKYSPLTVGYNKKIKIINHYPIISIYDRGYNGDIFGGIKYHQSYANPPIDTLW